MRIARSPVACRLLRLSITLCAVTPLAMACGPQVDDAGPGTPNDAGDDAPDGGRHDGGQQGPDSGSLDGGMRGDGGPPDGGQQDPDSGALDSGMNGDADGGTATAGGDLILNVFAFGGGPVLEGTVHLGAQTAALVNGRADLSDIVPGAHTAVIEAPGYASASTQVVIVADAVTQRLHQLLAIGAVVPFDAATGATLRFENVGVQLFPNSFVDAAGAAVTGEIIANITAFDPATDMPAAPGTFRGEDDVGQSTLIETFGMGNFTFTAAGEPVNLAPGQSALVEIVIGANPNVTAGETIPAWSLDLSTGRWLQEALGSVSGPAGRRVWTASVTHFTWWNCDAPFSDTECAVVQLAPPPAGQNVENVSIGIDGVTFSGSDEAWTDATGSGCVEFKRGEEAQLKVTDYSNTYTYTQNIVGSGDPADCSPANADGCVAVLVEAPLLGCAHGQVIRNGIGVENAILFFTETVSRVVRYQLTDANGEYCFSAPLNVSFETDVYFTDPVTKKLYSANGGGTMGGEVASCGTDDCAMLPTFVLQEAPVYCLDGEATHAAFDGPAPVPAGTPVHAFRASNFGGVDCNTTAQNWGTRIATGTVGANGAYCLDLPISEGDRDLVIAVDGCNVSFPCETEMPAAYCSEHVEYTVPSTDEMAATGASCISPQPCASTDVYFAFP